MSNKEIEKQAEELIEKHIVCFFGEPSKEPSPTEEGLDKYFRKDFIKAAIVSCEFAKPFTGIVIPNWEELDQIQKYLEGLL